MNRPIPGFSDIFFSKVYAKSDDTQLKKIMTFDDLILDDLIFKTRLNIDGFSLEGSSSLPPKTCHDMNLFSTKLALVLAKKKTASLKWEKYIEKCSFEFRKNMVVILELKNNRFEKEENLRAFLKPYRFKKEVEKKIMKIFNKKNNFFKKRLIIDKFIEFNRNLGGIKSGNENDKYFLIEESFIENKFENVFIKTIMDLNIALEVGNSSWAKFLLINLAYFNKLRYINSIQSHYFSSPKQLAEFQKSIMKVLGLAYEKLKYKELIQIVINRFMETFEAKYFHDLQKKTLANWSLSEIRERSSSITFGRLFPDFWYNELLSRTTKNELNSFLVKNLKKRNVQTISIHSYGLFLHYLPKDDEKRKIIVNRLLNIDFENDCYLGSVLMYLLENETLKREISKKSKKLSSANFNLKRKYHKTCLNKGVGINFHLYNLFKLGDKHEDMLWWLVL